ncbi:serine protease 27 [Thunnus albacares]|uniref:serine protease 27 n=1 Tax=Thunnus albacares TaxID=8236 RepID=UPI001CF68C54|nr:serine protease 27 [Thunnus albacares]
MDSKALVLFTLCWTAQTSPQDTAPGRPPGASQIVGGQEAPEGAWPWQVSIQLLSRHHSGGTILNSLWVLAATHCFHKYKRISRTHFRVVAGLGMLSALGGNAQICSIRLVKMQENYSDVMSDNDVIHELLSSPFNFTDHVQPEDLVKTPTMSLAQFESGLGRRLMNRLQEVELIDRRTCNLISWYDGLITENMICAGLESGAMRLPLRLGMYARTSRFSGWQETSQYDTDDHSNRLLDASSSGKG